MNGVLGAMLFLLGIALITAFVIALTVHAFMASFLGGMVVLGIIGAILVYIAVNV